MYNNDYYSNYNCKIIIYITIIILVNMITFNIVYSVLVDTIMIIIACGMVIIIVYTYSNDNFNVYSNDDFSLYSNDNFSLCNNDHWSLFKTIK